MSTSTIDKSGRSKDSKKNGIKIKTGLDQGGPNVSVRKLRNSCETVSQILKALSHPQRLIILGYLLQDQKTVGELVELCEISQSQISQFLVRMKAEGLVISERIGKFQYYSVADERLVHLMRVLQSEYCAK